MGKGRTGWLVLVLLLTLCGCNRNDADRLARVSRKAAAKVEGMTGAAPDRLAEGWTALRAGLDEVALDARVSARLRWDKGLAGAHIEVRASGGVVELLGTVVDDSQRGRAIDVAQATVGVERVTNNLEISADQPRGGS
jgi:osmotically-inducible protein OsmY